MSKSNGQEIIDLEELAHRNQPPPRAKKYRIRIDKEKHVVEVPCMTGQELLQLARKCPPNRYQIFQKLRGGKLDQVELDKKADFTRPGVERFVTLPLDQTEG